MPRDGSGNYIRPAGQPVSSGTVIDAGVFNTLTTDIATALTGSMPRDGQAPPLQDLPMGGFKLTGLASGSAAADSVTLGQAQGAAAQWLTSIAGTANAVEGAASPAITAYAAGQTFRFVPASTNTGATTLKIGGLATQNVFAFGAACVGGELVAGVPVTVVHDGTRFQIVNSQILPANKGASRVLLNRTPASGASAVTWNNSAITSTYERYEIVVNDLSFSTTADLWFQFSSDNGSTWIAGTSNVHSRLGMLASGNGQNATIAASTGDSKVVFGTGLTSAYRSHLALNLDVGSIAAVYGAINFFAAGVTQGGGQVYGGTNATCNAVRLLPSTGTFSGNFSIYGVKKS